MDITTLPDGVNITPLKNNCDSRGIFTEIFREEWGIQFPFPQWNIVHSNANVLRGVHVHAKHADYLLMIAGKMQLLLHDIRPESKTVNDSYLLSLDGEKPSAVIIPPGVAHGFYFPVNSIHFYAMSEYWNEAEEIGCMWNCPELTIKWASDNPILSEKDINALQYETMVQEYMRLRNNIEMNETAA